jgi:hydrogenase expression/formation protein HypC
MRVVQAWADGALVAGRAGTQTIDTRLVGPCLRDEWLLVFQGAARERLDAQRAAEIEAALDLLQAGLAGDLDAAQGDPGFALPSAMSAAQLAALVAPGAATTAPPEGDPP